MKKSFFNVALLVGLSMATIGCQKENLKEPEVIEREMEDCISVDYTVDGVAMRAFFSDEASWRTFVHNLFVLAEEGHRVSFCDSNRTQRVSKETVTYTTKSRQDAEDWAKAMVVSGYEVTITYDKNTNLYTCVASK